MSAGVSIDDAMLYWKDIYDDADTWQKREDAFDMLNMLAVEKAKEGVNQVYYWQEDQ